MPSRTLGLRIRIAGLVLVIPHARGSSDGQHRSVRREVPVTTADRGRSWSQAMTSVASTRDADTAAYHRIRRFESGVILSDNRVIERQQRELETLPFIGCLVPVIVGVVGGVVFDLPN